MTQGNKKNKTSLSVSNSVLDVEHEITKKARKKATQTLLSVAESASVEEIVRLVQEGADVNAADEYGRTPLMYAAEYNPNPDVSRFLIEKEANVNAASAGGRTPLMYAAEKYNFNPDVLRFLIDKGANVNAASADGWTPLMRIVAYRRFCSSFTWSMGKKSWIEAGVFACPLISAEVLTFNSDCLLNSDLIRYLIEKGASVDAADKLGTTLLMFVAFNYREPEFLRYLIEKGADVNAVDCDGWTPLMLAASGNFNPEVLIVLIDNGANVNAVDCGGKTPLMYAAERNNPDVLQVLLDNGADVSIKNCRREKALDYNEWYFGKNALDYAEENEELRGTEAYNLLREKTFSKTD